MRRVAAAQTMGTAASHTQVESGRRARSHRRFRFIAAPERATPAA
jgi:hypothetical protein